MNKVQIIFLRKFMIASLVSVAVVTGAIYIIDINNIGSSDVIDFLTEILEEMD